MSKNKPTTAVHRDEGISFSAVETIRFYSCASDCVQPHTTFHLRLAGFNWYHNYYDIQLMLTFVEHLHLKHFCSAIRIHVIATCDLFEPHSQQITLFNLLPL